MKDKDKEDAGFLAESTHPAYPCPNAWNPQRALVFVDGAGDHTVMYTTCTIARDLSGLGRSGDAETLDSIFGGVVPVPTIPGLHMWRGVVRIDPVSDGENQETFPRYEGEWRSTTDEVINDLRIGRHPFWCGKCDGVGRPRES